jgi:hypothetical protein
VTDSPHPTPSRFRRTNLVLWALIGALSVFVLAAQFIPAHWVLGGIAVALLLTRSHAGGEPTEPSTIGGEPGTIPDTARFGRDIPSVVLACLWCGSELDDHHSDFCNDWCRDSWFAASLRSDS